MNKLKVCTKSIAGSVEKSIAGSVVIWKSLGTAAHVTDKETETQETMGTRVQHRQRQTLEG